MQEGHHHHGHHHGRTGNIKTAFLLNFCFTIIEIIGGILTNSVAILSDALHDLGDTLSLGLSWYFERISENKRSAGFSYGMKRFSLLAAMLNSIILLIGSGFILYEAIPRLMAPELVQPKGMAFLAVLGIIFNGAAVLRLRKGETMNEEMVSWHLMEDVLGWAAVLIASVVMIFIDLPILDPILSIGITVFILWNVLKRAKKTLKIFLQGVPEGIDLGAVHQEIRSIPGIIDLHDTHIWSMDGAYHILSTHVVVRDDASMESIQTIKDEVKRALKKMQIDHATIEVEQESEICEQVDC